ncbi:MAG: hypothetical protein V3V08_05695 [Nannocystaceae bacterium]
MSSDAELTDRECHEMANRFSLGCPNCEGRISVHFTADVISESFRDEFTRHLRNGDCLLAPVESSAERLKEHRDAGRTLNPAARKWFDNK